jgi:hypothetical protein
MLAAEAAREVILERNMNNTSKESYGRDHEVRMLVREKVLEQTEMIRTRLLAEGFSNVDRLRCTRPCLVSSLRGRIGLAKRVTHL